MIKPLRFSFFLCLQFGLGLFLIISAGCDSSSAPPSSRCEEFNSVVTRAQAIHVTRAEEELPELYRQAIENVLTLEPLWAKVALSASRPVEETLRRLEEFQASLPRTMDEQCTDIERISEFIDGELDHPIANPSLIYQLALSAFATQLDPLSRYHFPPAPSLIQTPTIPRHYGILVESRPQEIYQSASPSEELRIIALRRERNADLTSGAVIEEIFDQSGQRWISVRDELSEAKSAEARLEKFLTLAKRVNVALNDELRIRVNGNEYTLSAIDDSPAPSVGSEIVDPDSGVLLIRITEFNVDTAHDFLAELNRRRAQVKNPLAGLIIDLRYNSGGAVLSMNHLLHSFLPDTAVYITESKLPRNHWLDYFNIPARKVVRTEQTEAMVMEPTVILVNHRSASASEVFSQSLAEHGRAVIVGEKTFGKFISQHEFPLGVGSFIGGGLMVTVERIYGPVSGRCLQKEGLEVTHPIATNNWIRMTQNTQPGSPPLYQMADFEKWAPAVGRPVGPATTLPALMKPPAPDQFFEFAKSISPPTIVRTNSSRIAESVKTDREIETAYQLLIEYRDRTGLNVASSQKPDVSESAPSNTGL